jgi:acyl carrier protein
VIDRREVVVTISERLGALIGPVAPHDLAETRDLRDFPGFDSLGVLETLVWLETRFAIQIPDEELLVDRFNSVGKMADYVVAHTP